MPQQSDSIARDLRSAVLAGQHGDAARLAEEYAQALRREWERMPRVERVASNIPRQSRELLTWALGVTRMQHSMAGQHLAALGIAHQYLKARSNYVQASVD
jgi:predicted TPR repeat methyltransferase